MRRALHVAICCLAVLFPAGMAAGADIVGPAFVSRDASLLIHGQRVRLAGIYVPPTDFTCRTFERPVVCGSRTAVALDFHIGSHMVQCRSVGSYNDGSIAAICYLRDSHAQLDLAAWLITQGLALAGPDAPFDYIALERIARAQRRGVWSFPVDRIE
jgi:endonuclease YncB( thermonuclease family)